MQETLSSYGMRTKYRVSSLGHLTNVATAASLLVQTPTKQLSFLKGSTSIKVKFEGLSERKMELTGETINV
jgi:hypothetical protein